MDELQTGIEPTLAVLPQPPALLQPRKAALHYPTLWHDLEGVQLTALCDLDGDMFTQCVTHALRKGLAHIAAVAQHAFHLREVGFTTRQRLQSPFAICDLCRSHCHRARQALRVYSYVALDARDLLARVIALQARRVRVLHALRVHDQERA